MQLLPDVGLFMQTVEGVGFFLKGANGQGFGSFASRWGNEPWEGWRIGGRLVVKGSPITADVNT